MFTLATRSAFTSKRQLVGFLAVFSMSFDKSSGSDYSMNFITESAARKPTIFSRGMNCEDSFRVSTIKT